MGRIALVWLVCSLMLLAQNTPSKQDAAPAKASSSAAKPDAKEKSSAASKTVKGVYQRPHGDAATEPVPLQKNRPRPIACRRDSSRKAGSPAATNQYVAVASFCNLQHPVLSVRLYVSKL